MAVSHYQTPKGHRKWRFYFRYDDPFTGQRIPVKRDGFATRAEAAAAEADELSARNAGEVQAGTKGQSKTVGQWLTQWLVGRELAASTRSLYALIVNAYLIPELGDIALRRLTPEDVETCYARIRSAGQRRAGVRHGQPLSGKYRHEIHVVLHKALVDAVRHREIRMNPADHLIDVPQGEKRKKTTWKMAEVHRFVADCGQHLDDPRYVAMLLMLAIGARRGEVLAVTWRDVDLDDAVIDLGPALIAVQGYGIGHSAGKTPAADRAVPLAQPMVEALRTYREAQAAAKTSLWVPDDGRVFTWFRKFSRHQRTTHAPGDPIHPVVVMHQFERVVARLELPRIRLYDLRSTHASLLGRHYGNRTVIKAILGHADSDVTDLYTDVPIEAKREAIDLVVPMMLAPLTSPPSANPSGRHSAHLRVVG